GYFADADSGFRCWQVTGVGVEGEDVGRWAGAICDRWFHPTIWSHPTDFGGEAVGEGDAGQLGGAAEVVGENDDFRAVEVIQHWQIGMNRRKQRQRRKE